MPEWALAVIIPLAMLGLALGTYAFWARRGTRKPVEHNDHQQHWSPYS